MSAHPARSGLPAAFGTGATIGTLGGLMGLGGAEFRLPLLIGLFRFAALEAVILNKATSLVVVAAALPFRAGTVPFVDIAAEWPILLNLLAGSLAGAWFGAGWATRLRSGTLYKVPAAILLPALAAIQLLSAAKVWRHRLRLPRTPLLLAPGRWRPPSSLGGLVLSPAEKR